MPSEPEGDRAATPPPPEPPPDSPAKGWTARAARLTRRCSSCTCPPPAAGPLPASAQVGGDPSKAADGDRAGYGHDHLSVEHARQVVQPAESDVVAREFD